MCKYKWRKIDMRWFPLETIYEKFGKTKDNDSLVVATEEEKEMLAEIMEEENDADAHDDVVESWMNHINKVFTVQFEDMLAENLEGRVPKKEVNAGIAGNKGQAKKTSRTELVNAVKSMGEEMKSMGEEMKGLVDKLDGLERRMLPLEAYVKKQTMSGGSFYRRNSMNE